MYADSENGTIYGVTETATGDRWTLTGATCAYAFTEKRLPIEGTSSIQVYPGDEVTCVFTNSYDPPPVSGGSGGGGSAPVAPVTSPESTTPKVLGATTTVGDPANLSKYDLKEQDLIQAEGDHNIYILNSAGYKRLYLNPIIFGYYGDDLWARVKIVSPEVRDAFPTSYLFRNCETGEPKVYGANITGEDTGELHWLNISGTQALGEDGHFFKKVFCINSAELDWFLD